MILPLTNKRTILIVDDEPTNLMLLYQYLRSVGYHIVVAQDGGATIAVVEQVSPDLIILDVVMPDIDGFELYRRLRQKRTTCAIPIIFLTGLAEDADALVHQIGDAVEYLLKPVDLPDLLTRITKYMDRPLERND